MRSKHIMLLLALWVGAMLAMIGACSSESQLELDSVTALPTTTRPHTPQPTSVVVRDTPSPTPAATSLPDKASPTGTDVRYDIQAVLDWPAHTVQVEQQVHFRNDTAFPLDEIIFTVEVNREPEDFQLREVRDADDQRITDYALDGSRLTVFFPEALPPGDETTVTLDYRLAIPQIVDGYREGHLGYWGYSERQINLGLWFPLVAAYDGTWITPAFHWVGEHFRLRAADFTVELHIDEAPAGVRVAGPGTVEKVDAHTWRFALDGARELSISLSEQFKVLRNTSPSGVAVELYYLPVDAADAPRYALDVAVDALALYEELYGPYPYKRLVVVQGDFPDGMEFSGLVFVSDHWFATWKERTRSWLTVITAHEIAHQWWYVQVGNDQGMTPYLDEALAIYSEVLFLERYYPNDIEWWWQFRVDKYEPTGYVDTPIYDFYSPRGYINAIYLRGALMMEALRQDMGDPAFFAWLRRYGQLMHGQIADPVDFWGAMPDEQYAATKATRQKYLQQPAVLPRQSSALP
jgi:hypothetical protein